MSAAKTIAGRLMAAANPQCRYDRACLLIGHMRCGSTALAAILTSHGEFSGYGEAHIAYRTTADLGLLAINQWRRGAWDRKASGLFDKILHNRYDLAVPAAYYGTRAVFMAREPMAAVLSIRELFSKIESREYPTDNDAARYYCQRLEALLDHWPRFGERRIALTYEQLVAAPEPMLARMSERLQLTSPLTNRYAIKAASQAHGGGDPLNAARFARIAPLPARPASRDLAIDRAICERAHSLFEQFRLLAEG